MSAIAGVFRLDGAPLDPELPARMVARLAHRGPDGKRTWSQGGIGLGQCMLRTTPESLNESQPLVDFEGALVLVADARLDNRDELMDLLEVDTPGSRRPVTDSRLILAAYRRWGEGSVERLLGDYALAIWDGDRRRLFCARDHMGVKSFYYFCGSKSFVFATEIKALFEVPEVSRELDEERLAKHLRLEFDESESTFYRDVRRLPPAHSLVVGNGTFTKRRYWSPDPQQELTLGSDEAYAEAFREVFFEAVRCRLRSALRVGATLSGGLDSTSICCAARDLLSGVPGRKLHTFSLVFPGLTEGELRRIDERSYVDVVLEGGDFEGHRIEASRLSPLDELEALCQQLDEPLVPFNLYLHQAIYRSAQEQGVQILLDGFDGDTTLSYGFGRLAELFATLRWITLGKEVKAFRSRVPNPTFTARKILWTHAIRPAIPPVVRRLRRLVSRRPGGDPDGERLIAAEFADRLGKPVASPKGKAREEGRATNDRQRHSLALQSPLLPGALELVDKEAGALSIEPRYPFFDRRLVEFCLALPSEQKFKYGWTRWILRRSMQGILPPQVQWRRDKANLSPNFHRGLRASGGQLLERMLSEYSGEIAPYVDVREVTVLLRRYLENRTPRLGMRLFTVLALGVWLRQKRDV